MTLNTTTSKVDGVFVAYPSRAILAGCLFGQTNQIAEPHLESLR
jgi:hypothetical protein